MSIFALHPMKTCHFLTEPPISPRAPRRKKQRSLSSLGPKLLGVAHRDLKLENFLLTGQGDFEEETVLLKLVSRRKVKETTSMVDLFEGS